MYAANNRKESRGAHAREDFTVRVAAAVAARSGSLSLLRAQERNDEEWMKHTLSWEEPDGKIRLGYRPVHMHVRTHSRSPHMILPHSLTVCCVVSHARADPGQERGRHDPADEARLLNARPRAQNKRSL